METIEVTADHLRHRIPAPIDAECLTSPAQIEPRDHVMVHAMGSWYPGVVLNVRPKSGKLEVEYTSGTRTVRRTIVARQALVPSMCGYPRRTHGGEAAAWAAAVWAALEAYRAPSMTTIGKDVSEGIAALNAATVKAFDEGTLPTIDAGRVMTDGPDRNAGGPKIKIRVADDAGTRAAVESARAALGPRKVRRRVTMSVRLPVSVELLVESEDEVGVGGVDVEDTAKERLIARIRRAEYQLRRKAQEHAAAVARAAELAPGEAPVPGEASSAETLADLEAAAFRYAELVPLKKRRRRKASR